MEALLSSLTTMPESADKFIVSVSFHFQCINPLIFYTVVLQLSKVILTVLVFKIKGISMAGLHYFSSHKNIPAFWLNFNLLVLLFKVIVSLCKSPTGTEIPCIYTIYTIYTHTI